MEEKPEMRVKHYFMLTNIYARAFSSPSVKIS
jgi:hypothetical protein